jgi:hypothetical protein
MAVKRLMLYIASHTNMEPQQDACVILIVKAPMIASIVPVIILHKHTLYPMPAQHLASRVAPEP